MVAGLVILALVVIFTVNNNQYASNAPAVASSTTSSMPPTATSGASDNDNSSTAEAASAPAPASPALKVGDTFDTPTFEITVVSTHLRSSVGNEFDTSQAAAGGIYVAILWQYKNISNKPVDAFDLPTLHLIAPDGTKYDPDLDGSTSYQLELNTDAKVLSDLNPGIRVNDGEVFEVSRNKFNEKTWKILVDADQPVQVSFASAKP